MTEKPPRPPGHEPTAVLTREAYERLKAELHQLTGEGRAHMADRLQHARELGDISENAEFDAAKEQQGLMEARIRDLERMLKDPDIIEGPEDAEAAAPGVLVTVRLEEDEDEDEETYLLAASKEERVPGARTVSTDSPLGRAILDRKVGDRVSYEAPGGRFTLEITGLEPRS